MNVNAFYEKVTNEVIEMLEQGQVPWQQTWLDGSPQNAKTGYNYHGFNSFWASFDTYLHKFDIARYATFKQISDAGGTLKKGAHGIGIVYFAPVTYNAKDKLEKDEVETINTYRPVAHYVFNICQVIGAYFESTFQNEPILDAEMVIKNFKNAPKIEIKAANDPKYQPLFDLVFMPPISSFHSSNEYYLTLFHELAHSTGHEKRLKREFGKKSEIQKYALEELVAEITSYMLASKVGIHNQITNSNTQAYLQFWIKALQNDKQLLFKACNMAQKACDYILGMSEKTILDKLNH
ncbi:MAG: zincin-like metallopeptidase domain-containing protein [Bacteroidota bacterium]